MSRDLLREQGLSKCSYCGQVYRWECLCWPYNGRSKEAKAYRAIAAGQRTEDEDAMRAEAREKGNEGIGPRPQAARAASRV